MTKSTAFAATAAMLLGGCASYNISMPEVRGMSCPDYAAQIAELDPEVAATNGQRQAEMVASFGVSLLAGPVGLMNVPIQHARGESAAQKNSDLWSYRVAWDAARCEDAPAVVAGNAGGVE